MTPENLDKWKIVPRLMMLVMTGVYPLHRVGIEPARIIHARSGSNIGRHGAMTGSLGSVS